jgi:hypothetical protein
MEPSLDHLFWRVQTPRRATACPSGINGGGTGALLAAFASASAAFPDTKSLLDPVCVSGLLAVLTAF